MGSDKRCIIKLLLDTMADRLMSSCRCFEFRTDFFCLLEPILNHRCMVGLCLLKSLGNSLSECFADFLCWKQAMNKYRGCQSALLCLAKKLPADEHFCMYIRPERGRLQFHGLFINDLCRLGRLYYHGVFEFK